MLRTLVKVFPQHVITQIKFELHMLRVRLGSPLRRGAFRGKTDMLVNIGAGDTGLDGWVNMDAFKCTGVNCLWDPRQAMPFDDNSVRGIFSEHFFEHIHYTEEAPAFLQECHRVLKPGGIVRIIVPDAGRYLKAYAAASPWNEMTSLRPLEAERLDPYFGWTYNTPMELVNAVFRQIQEHKFAYDFETLAFILKQNGFVDIEQRSFRDSAMPELAIGQESRKTESLYVEARKPVTESP